MSVNPNRLWIIVLLLGFSFDFLFWKQPAIGVNFALFTVLSLLGGMYLLISSGKKPSHSSLFILIPFVFFVFISFIRREPLTLFLAYLFSLLSLGIFTVSYMGGSWVQYSLPDYIKKIIFLLSGLRTAPANFFKQVYAEETEQEKNRKRTTIIPILRGILIAIPIVLFFAYLFSSADMVFSQKLSDFFEHFNFERAPEYFLRLLIILFFAYVLAGIFLHAATKSHDEKLIGWEQGSKKLNIGFVEAAIVLGSVSILFLSFVIIQFRYFFGGDLNIGVGSFTYSQYARQGFNELVIVAFFSLLMILVFSIITRRESEKEKRIFSAFTVVIVTLVMVILVSAFQRLLLAVDWHGFSRLRVYPQVFLVWIGILLITIAVLEASRHERYFTFAIVIAAMGFAVSLAVFNVDNSIAQHNILRASQEKHFNPSYLASLSLDAVPALVDGYHDLTLPQDVHEGVGAALLCHQRIAQLENDDFDNWRSFNVSRWRAKYLLENIADKFDGYLITGKRTSSSVRTPSNKIIECVDTSSSYR
jgi:hypothetical protein